MTERRERDRGQLSLSVVEAAVGVVLVLAVAGTLALGVPSADPVARDAQLETYAGDAATVLATEPPRHGGSTRLTEVTRSPMAFARERAAFDQRVDRLLPDNLMYAVETPHGTVGFPRPSAAAVGVASVSTPAGEVTIRVWYA